MFTSSNNPTYPESGFLPWLKDSIFGVGKYKRTHTNKLPMVRICLLFVMVFVGYEAIFEYAKLQRTNAADSELINNYLVRQYTKPGITGWAQVNGYRGETKKLIDMENRVEFDIWYIENWSLILDMRIILKTIMNVLHGEKNAY